MTPKPCFSFLKEQLGDIMLIILIFAAILSLVLNFATASPEEYSVGKYPLAQRSFILPVFVLNAHLAIGWSCQAPVPLCLWINKINYNLFSVDWWYCDSYCSRSRLGCWIHRWLEKGNRIRQPSQRWWKRQHCKFLDLLLVFRSARFLTLSVIDLEHNLQFYFWILMCDFLNRSMLSEMVK